MKKTKKSFDKVHKYYDGFMKFFGLYREKEIAEILGLTGCERLLDIGGGTGYLADHLIDECHEIYVLDESEKMLSHVSKKKGINIVLGDALNLPFEDKSLDVVILSDVFHHIEDQEKLLIESLRVLKHGGKILIHDFDIRYAKTKILRGFEKNYFGKLYFKTIDDVVCMMKDKFHLLDKKSRGYYFILLGEK